MDTGIDSLKTAFKKAFHRADELLGNKTVDAITKWNDYEIVKHDENPRNAEEIIIPQEKRWNMKQIEKSIIKMECYELSKLLNDLAASKFVTKNILK